MYFWIYNYPALCGFTMHAFCLHFFMRRGVGVTVKANICNNLHLVDGTLMLS